MLRDAARLARRNIGVANGVEQRRFSVIDVAHDRDHRRARHEVFGVVVFLAEHIRLDERLALHLEAELLRHQRRRVLIDRRIQRDAGHAERPQLLQHIGRLDAHLLGGIGDGDGVLHLDHALVLRRRGDLRGLLLFARLRLLFALRLACEAIAPRHIALLRQVADVAISGDATAIGDLDDRLAQVRQIDHAAGRAVLDRLFLFRTGRGGRHDRGGLYRPLDFRRRSAFRLDNFGQRCWGSGPDGSRHGRDHLRGRGLAIAAARGHHQRNLAHDRRVLRRGLRLLADRGSRGRRLLRRGRLRVYGHGFGARLDRGRRRSDRLDGGGRLVHSRLRFTLRGGRLGRRGGRLRMRLNYRVRAGGGRVRPHRRNIFRPASDHRRVQALLDDVLLSLLVKRALDANHLVAFQLRHVVFRRDSERANAIHEIVRGDPEILGQLVDRHLRSRAGGPSPRTQTLVVHAHAFFNAPVSEAAS